MLQKYQAGLSTVILALAGCASMPLTTMYKLYKIDPLEADPAQIKVAVIADERIDIPKNGAAILLEFDAEDGSLHIDENFILEIVRNPIFTQELAEAKTPGKAVTVLQLSESDALKMKQLQSLLVPYKEGDRKGTAKLGVSLSGICSHSHIPAGKGLVDIYLQTSDLDGFFVITRDLDLREKRIGVDANMEDWLMCE